MSKGLSLHIGLNLVDSGHYQGWSGPLAACEADARDMKDIADGQGFESTLLLTKHATRDAVASSLTEAASALNGGDILFVSYSGHGGQVPDTNGDEEFDLADETWCLYDGQLIDDELAVSWSRFREGVRILVLSDSCHSGSVTRAHYDLLDSVGITGRSLTGAGVGTAPVYRVMPDEVALRTYRANRAFYKGISRDIPQTLPDIAASVRLISGCQDNQLSMDGPFNGAFTATVLRVWDDGNFAGNYREFHRAIVRRMPATQSPNHYNIGSPNASYDAEKPFTI